MLQAAVLIVFPALMVFAALSDLFTMEISNRIPVALVVLFLPFAIWAGLPAKDIAIHFACGLGVLAITFTLFAFNKIGGGDAKLAAATAVWIGWENLGEFGLDTAMFGGALALLILYARHVPLPRWAVRIDWMTRLHDRKEGIPYGIALAIAGLLLFPQTGLWAAASIA